VAGTRGGGGLIGNSRPVLDFKGKCWRAKTNGGQALPLPRLLGECHTLYAGARMMGVFDGECSLGGEG
jgi:hypothetical protein